MGDTACLPWSAHTQIRREGNQSLVQVLRREVPDRIMPRLVLNALEAEHHIVRHGGILLHSSFIRVGYRAILFTAPSGTGKSTQAQLWQTHRGAQILNGDRTAVTVGAEGVKAHGIPYCGTSGICKNAELTVAAIVYLTQGKESVAQPLTGLRAFRRLWEGCSVNTWDREDVQMSTNTVTEIIRQVPVIHLSCTPVDRIVFCSNVVWVRGRVVRGEGLTEASYTPHAQDCFVRAEIFDAQGNCAWSNIIRLD
jgi:hypothetical protein